MIHAYGTWQCDMTLSGSTLRLDGAPDTYDLDGDAVEEEVTWYLTLGPRVMATQSGHRILPPIASGA